ncbi:MAG: hypothetical protein PWP31_133 [Clostridia bacterium]|nr:hypothetical protein [Clostridia bacterium]
MLKAERGLVMDREGDRVIVLTPEGEWRTVKPAGVMPEMGEEIMLPVEKRGLLTWQVVTVAAILLLCLTIPLANHIFNSTAPGQLAYYVNVDINPSVELAVDERNRVISAQGLNKDGEKLLSGLDLCNERVLKAVKIIAQESVRQGYYQPDEQDDQGAMMVTVIPVADDTNKNLADIDVDDLGKKLIREAQGVLDKNRIKAEVVVATVPPDIRQHATELGLSAGKYSVMLEALAEGVPLTVDDLKEKSIVKALKNADCDWKQVLNQLKEEKDLLKKEKQLGPILKVAVSGGNIKGEQDLVKKPGNKEQKEDKKPGHGHGADPAFNHRRGYTVARGVTDLLEVRRNNIYNLSLVSTCTNP